MKTGLAFCPEDGSGLVAEAKCLELRPAVFGTWLIAEISHPAGTGIGGMGSVYLAEQVNLSRRVAIKVLHQELSSDSEMLRRFQNEAVTVGKLTHPNIVTIYEMDQTAG